MELTRHIASGQESESWIRLALKESTEPRWEKAVAALKATSWEKHGDSALYDEDVRFILKIPAEKRQDFYDILAGLAEKALNGDRKIFIGGAWHETGAEEYYGIRVSQSVAHYLQQQTGLTLEGQRGVIAR